MMYLTTIDAHQYIAPRALLTDGERQFLTDLSLVISVGLAAITLVKKLAR